MKNVMVSVIVPVYNVEKYIKRCVESIAMQTYQNIEIILVDDGSTDTSGKICDELSEKYPAVKVIHQENGGLSDARNAGLKAATGEYVLFVDSDDYIIYDAVEKLVHKATRENLDVLRADCIIECDERTTFRNDERKVLEGEVLTGLELFKKAYINNLYNAVAWKGLYRRQFLINNNLWFKKGIYHEDEQWTPRVILKAKRVNYMHFPFYRYMMNDSSITHMSDKTKHGRDLIQTALELSGEEVPKKYKSVWNDLVVGLYYYGVRVGKLYKKEHKDLISKSFALKHGMTKKNWIRSLLFVVNYRLFIKIDNLYRNASKI